MVDDAEKYKKEDEAIAKKINARNALENYCFQIKNIIYDNNLKGHFSNPDKKAIQEASAEGLAWIEGPGRDAGFEEVEEKQKEVESKYNPIMARIYAESGVDIDGKQGLPKGF